MNFDHKISRRMSAT